MIVNLLIESTTPPAWDEKEAACSSALLPVEVRRTLLRERAEGHLDDLGMARAVAVLERYHTTLDLARMSAPVLRRAGEAFPVHLRTLDAIHLATALHFRERFFPGLVFATHDRRLGIAAATLEFDIAGIKL